MSVAKGQGPKTVKELAQQVEELIKAHDSKNNKELDLMKHFDIEEIYQLLTPRAGKEKPQDKFRAVMQFLTDHKFGGVKEDYPVLTELGKNFAERYGESDRNSLNYHQVSSDEGFNNYKNNRKEMEKSRDEVISTQTGKPFQSQAVSGEKNNRHEVKKEDKATNHPNPR